MPRKAEVCLFCLPIDAYFMLTGDSPLIPRYLSSVPGFGEPLTNAALRVAVPREGARERPSLHLFRVFLMLIIHLLSRPRLSKR